MRIVMLDTETTGLIVGVHQIVEVAWSTLESDQTTSSGGLTGWSPVRTLVFPHNLVNADAKALEVNHYHDRGFANAQEADGTKIDELYGLLEGACLAGANPAFDAGMLRAFNNNDPDPWHYRMLDIEAYAAGYHGWPVPRGLMATVEAMNAALPPANRISAPDHTAAGDVRTACQVYDIISGRTFLQGTPYAGNDSYVAHGSDFAPPVAA